MWRRSSQSFLMRIISLSMGLICQVFFRIADLEIGGREKTVAQVTMRTMPQISHLNEWGVNFSRMLIVWFCRQNCCSRLLTTGEPQVVRRQFTKRTPTNATSNMNSEKVTLFHSQNVWRPQEKKFYEDVTSLCNPVHSATCIRCRYLQSKFLGMKSLR